MWKLQEKIELVQLQSLLCCGDGQGLHPFCLPGLVAYGGSLFL